MPFTNWKSVKKDQELTNEKIASQFQYRHYINWEVDLLTVLGIGMSRGKGGWEIQLIGPTGQILFHQAVEIDLFLVSLGDLGQYLFTWYPNKETINTHVVGGVTTDANNPGWKFTIGGQPTSEFGTLIPGGGADYTSGTAYITTRWESPVYKMRLPKGTKLKVIRDSWGLGASSRPEYQFRYKYGAPRLIEAIRGRSDELVTVNGFASSTLLTTGHSWPGEYNAGRSRGLYLDGYWEPCLLELENGREILGVQSDDGFIEYESYDSQLLWTRVKYETEVPGEKKEEIVFPPNTTMPTILSTPQGRIILAVRGSDIVVRRTIGEQLGKLALVGKATGDQGYSLATNREGHILVVDESAMVVYFSQDGGATWQAKTDR